MKTIKFEIKFEVSKSGDTNCEFARGQELVSSPVGYLTQYYLYPRVRLKAFEVTVSNSIVTARIYLVAQGTSAR